MKLQRLPHWRRALIETVTAYQSKAFVWGETDCSLFVADCIKAMTGVDLGKGFRGKYKTAKGAAAALKRKKFKGAADLAASLFEEIPPSRAGVGDIVSVKGGSIDALGIVAGETLRVMTPDAGLGIMHLSEAKRAFRVP